MHLQYERPAEALPLLEKAAELAPGATSGIGAPAVAYARLGRRDEAVADFRKALALEPQNPFAHLTRQGLLRLGQTP